MTPIPVPPSPPAVGRERSLSTSSALRDRVEQVTGSANKVLTGVVDSVSLIRSLLPNATNPMTPAMDSLQGTAPWNAVPRPGFGILRRDSVFSIKSMLPGSTKAGDGEEMLDVSRPVSRAGASTYGSDMEDVKEDEDGGTDDSGSDSSDEDEEEEGGGRDARSIRSFESMMSRSRRERNKAKAQPRKSLSDRLSGITGGRKVRCHVFWAFHERC